MGGTATQRRAHTAAQATLSNGSSMAGQVTENYTTTAAREEQGPPGPEQEPEQRASTADRGVRRTLTAAFREAAPDADESPPRTCRDGVNEMFSYAQRLRAISLHTQRSRYESTRARSRSPAGGSTILSFGLTFRGHWWALSDASSSQTAASRRTHP